MAGQQTRCGAVSKHWMCYAATTNAYAQTNGPQSSGSATNAESPRTHARTWFSCEAADACGCCCALLLLLAAPAPAGAGGVSGTRSCSPSACCVAPPSFSAAARCRRRRAAAAGRAACSRAALLEAAAGLLAAWGRRMPAAEGQSVSTIGRPADKAGWWLVGQLDGMAVVGCRECASIQRRRLLPAARCMECQQGNAPNLLPTGPTSFLYHPAPNLHLPIMSYRDYGRDRSRSPARDYGRSSGGYGGGSR